MSVAAKLFREKWGTTSERISKLNNPDLAGNAYMMCGTYALLQKHLLKGAKKLKEIVGDIVYTREGRTIKKQAANVVTFGDHFYMEDFFNDMLHCVTQPIRAEEWLLEAEGEDGRPKKVHALVLIDARGDASALSEFNDGPDEEQTEEDDEFGKMLKEAGLDVEPDPPIIIAKLEELLQSTFDPFDF